MSSRIFKGITTNSTRDIMNKQRLIETGLVIEKVSNSTNEICFIPKRCGIITMTEYNRINIVQTNYNELSGNPITGEIYFNSNMNHGNFLTSNIDNSNILVNQLVYNLYNDMSLNLSTASEINTNGENLLSIDPSNTIFNNYDKNRCKNLFSIQNTDISYTIQTLNSINPIPGGNDFDNLCHI